MPLGEVRDCYPPKFGPDYTITIIISYDILLLIIIVTIFQTGNKKESEKLTKNIIKITVKLGILSRNDQFDSNELKLAENFKRKFRELIMITVSFYEIEFSYEKNYLVNYLFKCKEMLKELTKRHLTEKSLSRIDVIFEFFSNQLFLDFFFKRDSELTEVSHILINGLKELLDKDL